MGDSESPIYFGFIICISSHYWYLHYSYGGCIHFSITIHHYKREEYRSFFQCRSKPPTSIKSTVPHHQPFLTPNSRTPCAHWSTLVPDTLNTPSHQRNYTNSAGGSLAFTDRSFHHHSAALREKWLTDIDSGNAVTPSSTHN
jgi:hypothetical protein